MRNSAIKKILSILIAVLPSTALRRLCYNSLLGYRIDKQSKVEAFCFINVSSLEIGPFTTVEKFNVFSGPMSLSIGERSSIGSSNQIRCGTWTSDGQHSSDNYRRRMRVGNHCRVSPGHFFDANGEIVIGNNTWITGRGSQFWTHGASKPDATVSIGANSYVGSACRFAPGSGVADHCVVSLGSVVTKTLATPYRLVGGVPAREIKDIREDIESKRLHWSF